MDKIIHVELSEEFETVELYPFSDIHLGDALTRYGEFDDTLNMVLDAPNRYIILDGDLINNNLKNSVGSVYEDIIPPSQQKKEIKRLLQKVKDRIIVSVSGNHEYRTKKDADIDIAEDIADSLGVPYRPDEAIVKLTFGKKYNGKRQSYCIFVTHGSSGGKRPGSKLNNMEAYSMNIVADCYVFGHGHTRMAMKSIFRIPDLQNNIIREIEQVYTMASAWASYGGYAKRKGYRPQIRGSHPIILHSNKKKIEVII